MSAFGQKRSFRFPPMHAVHNLRLRAGVTERPILVCAAPLCSWLVMGLPGASHGARQHNQDTPLIEAWEGG